MNVLTSLAGSGDLATTSATGSIAQKAADGDASALGFLAALVAATGAVANAPVLDPTTAGASAAPGLSAVAGAGATAAAMGSSSAADPLTLLTPANTAPTVPHSTLATPPSTALASTVLTPSPLASAQPATDTESAAALPGLGEPTSPLTPVLTKAAPHSERPVSTPSTPPTLDAAPLTAEAFSVAAPATTNAVVAPAAPSTTTPTAVVQQVFPEVARLATAGNGTHRITLTLHPDDLGTVRVTLTVHDGSMRVSLAADQATDSLVRGCAELHRLLQDHSGGDARIVVRNIVTGTVAADTAASSATGTVTDFGSSQQRSAQHPFSDASGGFGQSAQHRPGPDDGEAALLRGAPRESTTDITTGPRPATRGVDQLI